MKLKLVIIIVFQILAGNLLAQDEYFKDSVQSKNLFKYEDRKSLFSIQLNGRLYSNYKILHPIGVNLNYERKIIDILSVKSTIGYSQSLTTYKHMEFSLSSRYYYNLRNRMYSGKTGNNFWANYFSFEIQHTVTFKRLYENKNIYAWDFNEGIWIILNREVTDYNIRNYWMYIIGFGGQRNMNKWLFIDWSVSYLYSYSNSKYINGFIPRLSLGLKLNNINFNNKK